MVVGAINSRFAASSPTLCSLCSLSLSGLSAPPRASPLLHLLPRHSPPPVLRLASSLLFRWASEFFSGFGLGVLLRGRLGGANGCPSLRLLASARAASAYVDSHVDCFL